MFGFHYEETGRSLLSFGHLNLLADPGIECYWSGGGSGRFEAQEKKVMEWRKERDKFFKTHQRSPLTPDEKKHFKGLKYYPFDPQYVFSGQIERYHSSHQ